MPYDVVGGACVFVCCRWELRGVLLGAYDAFDQMATS